MGLVYLFALVASLGLLILQILMGGKGDVGVEADADAEIGADADADVDADADADHGGDHAHDGHDHAHGHGPAPDPGVLALFLSTRFWIFFSLAFGLSGSLLHYLELASRYVSLGVALGAGLAGGLFAVLAFRAIKRGETGAAASTSDAVGRTGKVLVALAPGKVGQIRIELKGHSVDLLAMTDEEELARGEAILVEEMEKGVARVSRRPVELE